MGVHSSRDLTRCVSKKRRNLVFISQNIKADGSQNVAIDLRFVIGALDWWKDYFVCIHELEHVFKGPRVVIEHFNGVLSCLLTYMVSVACLPASRSDRTLKLPVNAFRNHLECADKMALCAKYSLVLPL